MFSDVRRHFLSNLESAPIIVEPFPHISVEGMFPGEFYQELLHNFPPIELYDRLIDTGRVADSHNKARKVLFPSEGLIKALPDTAAALWHQLFMLMIDQEIGSVLFGRFSEYLKPRFEAAKLNGPGELMVESEVFLVRDETEYELEPHRDIDSKLLTMLMYLPNDESNRDLGTRFYVEKDRTISRPRGYSYSLDSFDVAKSAPFLPNSLLCFPNTEHSFHGVGKISGERHRDLMIYDLRIARSV